MVTKLSPILKLFKNSEEYSEVTELKQAKEDQDDLADEVSTTVCYICTPRSAD